MLLSGYKSICDSHAAMIVSQDKKNPQVCHCALNDDRNKVTHYRIDGVIITEGKKCDFLLLNEDKKTAYLIELKGQHLTDAAVQLEATENALKDDLSSYEHYYRIVAKKCLTQSIQTSSYRKYQLLWGKRLKQASGVLEEKI